MARAKLVRRRPGPDRGKTVRYLTGKGAGARKMKAGQRVKPGTRFKTGAVVGAGGGHV